MKKDNSENSFYVDTSLPTKKGYQYFLSKFIKALGSASLIVGVIIAIIYVVFKIFKDTLKPQFDLKITLYIAIGCMVLAILCFIGYLILSNSHLKYVKKLYENYFDSFKEFNPVSLQLQLQSFYYIDNKVIHIFQNLEEITQINISEIEKISYNDNLVKVKPFSKYIYKRYIHKKPTCIGVTFSLTNDRKFIIAINLLLNKYSLEYSKKKKLFESNNEFTQQAFKKLEEDLNKINSIENSPTPILKVTEVNKDKTTSKVEAPSKDKPASKINEANKDKPASNVGEINKNKPTLKVEDPNKVKPVSKVENPNKDKTTSKVNEANKDKPISKVEDPNKDKPIEVKKEKKIYNFNKKKTNNESVNPCAKK